MKKCPSHKQRMLCYNLTSTVGSYMYMSPETFRGGLYNELADIFSLGCLIFELFARDLQVLHVAPATETGLYNYALMVSRGYRPDIPETFPSELTQLVEAMWDPDWSHRPSAAEVAERLEDLAELPQFRAPKGLFSACISA